MAIVITGSVQAAQTSGITQWNGAGTQYIVSASNGALYLFYIATDGDIYYRKSFNGGMTWGIPVTVSGAITATQLSVWYDRWSGINDDFVHICWSESAADDVTYRRLQTSASVDSLATAVIAFAGASTAANGALSICRARGGNLGIAYNIDGGTEDGFVRSTDTGSTWNPAADPTEAAADMWILMPGYNADAQDLQLFFWDVSADEISVKRYDDSANTWTETSISTGMVEQAQSTSFPNFAAVPDLANSRNVLVAWSAVDTANADLRCWLVDDTTITEKTNVVLNSVDDQGGCAVGIDTNSSRWYVFYAGNSAGSETWLGANNIYYKWTDDTGSTWSTETRLTDSAYTTGIKWLICSPRFSGSYNVAYHNDIPNDEIMVSTYMLIPTGSQSTLGGSITFS